MDVDFILESRITTGWGKVEIQDRVLLDGESRHPRIPSGPLRSSSHLAQHVYTTGSRYRHERELAIERGPGEATEPSSEELCGLWVEERCVARVRGRAGEGTGWDGTRVDGDG
jgi:hypothetical protein